MPYTPSLPTQLASAAPSVGGAAPSLLSALPDTATVFRAAAVSDGAGGQTTTWGRVGTWACWVKQTISYQALAQAGGAEAVTQWRGQFDLAADVQPADRVTVNGQTYEVTATDRGLSEALFLTAQLAKITPAPTTP